MFNSYKTLEKSLLASGHPATAKVLEAGINPRWAQRRSHNRGYTDSIVHWDVALHVIPESEPPFEVRQELRVDELVTLSRGVIVQVLYDPEDHNRMIVDPRTAPKTTQEAVAWYTDQAQAAMAREAAPLLEELEAAPDAASMQEAVKRNMLEQLSAANTGVHNPALEQAMAAVRAAPPVTPARAGFAPDVQSRLEQLSRLKDAGLIDDQQYATKRQQLLDQL